ncbi:CvpA family protein [Limoniibacter endophyticus]|uniref:Colicin V biosynthesis protein n=1 Tax=Limoniibacter endophyticus TaxID=1565040 RepID=A0A8J3DPD6_9HYPH|nr:CvpA family protein [Limoniibacter endophyticus]GHC68867.1 colicin V biosynthesis protein [Limoniibacter endophyticus]
MPITLLDGILVGFTLVSAVLAMVRGFSREVLAVISWVVAGFAAFTLYPTVLPYIAEQVGNPQVALAAAIGAVFLVTLIIMTLLTMKMADFIIDSRIGPLDRSLGFVYGAARGVLVVAVALLFFNWLAGEKTPAWVADAKSRPFLEEIGRGLESFLPEDPENTIMRGISGITGGAAPTTDTDASPPQETVPPSTQPAQQ